MKKYLLFLFFCAISVPSLANSKDAFTPLTFVGEINGAINGQKLYLTYNKQDLIVIENTVFKLPTECMLNRLFGNAEDDRLFGSAEDDRLFGSAEDDRLFGNAEDDRLFGNAEDDRLFGNAEMIYQCRAYKSGVVLIKPTPKKSFYINKFGVKQFENGAFSN